MKTCRIPYSVPSSTIIDLLLWEGVARMADEGRDTPSLESLNEGGCGLPPEQMVIDEANPSQLDRGGLERQEQGLLPCGCPTDSEPQSRAADTKVKWNPYNKVVQCHACGATYDTRVSSDAPQSEESVNAAQPSAVPSGKASKDKMENADQPLNVQVYRTLTEIIICGDPPDEPQNLSDKEYAAWYETSHNCDAMGCGFAHVLYRFPNPATQANSGPHTQHVPDQGSVPHLPEPILRDAALSALEWFAGFPHKGEASGFDVSTAAECYNRLESALAAPPVVDSRDELRALLSAIQDYQIARTAWETNPATTSKVPGEARDRLFTIAGQISSALAATPVEQNQTDQS